MDIVELPEVELLSDWGDRPFTPEFEDTIQTSYEQQATWMLSPASPTGPFDIDRMMDTTTDDAIHEWEDSSSGDASSLLPFEERFQATVYNLQQSMKRSQTTHPSLLLLQGHINVDAVMSAVQESAQQLQEAMRVCRDEEEGDKSVDEYGVRGGSHNHDPCRTTYY